MEQQQKLWWPRLVECSCAGEGTLRNNSSMLRFPAVSEPVVSDYDMSWLPDFSGGSAEDLDTMLDSICTPAVSTKPDLMLDSAIGGFCQPPATWPSNSGIDVAARGTTAAVLAAAGQGPSTCQWQHALPVHSHLTLSSPQAICTPGVSAGFIYSWPVAASAPYNFRQLYAFSALDSAAAASSPAPAPARNASGLPHHRLLHMRLAEAGMLGTTVAVAEPAWAPDLQHRQQPAEYSFQPGGAPVACPAPPVAIPVWDAACMSSPSSGLSGSAGCMLLQAPQPFSTGADAAGTCAPPWMLWADTGCAGASMEAQHGMQDSAGPSCNSRASTALQLQPAGSSVMLQGRITCRPPTDMASAAAAAVLAAAHGAPTHAMTGPLLAAALQVPVHGSMYAAGTQHVTAAGRVQTGATAAALHCSPGSSSGPAHWECPAGFLVKKPGTGISNKLISKGPGTCISHKLISKKEQRQRVLVYRAVEERLHVLASDEADSKVQAIAKRKATLQMTLSNLQVSNHRLQAMLEVIHAERNRMDAANKQLKDANSELKAQVQARLLQALQRGLTVPQSVCGNLKAA